jgi:hypothetical protein
MQFNWLKFLIFLILLVILKMVWGWFQNTDAFELTIFAEKNGWGYLIKHQNRLIIQQAHIPAIQNFQNFRSSAEARRVGKLVIYKLKNKQNPRITLAELDSLKIVH